MLFWNTLMSFNSLTLWTRSYTSMGIPHSTVLYCIFKKLQVCGKLVLVAQLVKNLPAMQDTWVRSLGWEDPLEKGMAGYPLQYSGLENSTDVIVHGVTKSWTEWLSPCTKQIHQHHFYNSICSLHVSVSHSVIFQTFPLYITDNCYSDQWSLMLQL